MRYMFNECHKLKYLNLSKFSLNNMCLTHKIFQYINNKESLFFSNDIILINIFYENT